MKASAVEAVIGAFGVANFGLEGVVGLWISVGLVVGDEDVEPAVVKHLSPKQVVIGKPEAGLSVADIWLRKTGKEIFELENFSSSFVVEEGFFLAMIITFSCTLAAFSDDLFSSLFLSKELLPVPAEAKAVAAVPSLPEAESENRSMNEY